MKSEAIPCGLTDPARKYDPKNREEALCFQLHDQIVVAAAGANVSRLMFSNQLSIIEAFIAEYRTIPAVEGDPDSDRWNCTKCGFAWKAADRTPCPKCGADKEPSPDFLTAVVAAQVMKKSKGRTGPEARPPAGSGMLPRPRLESGEELIPDGRGGYRLPTSTPGIAFPGEEEPPVQTRTLSLPLEIVPPANVVAETWLKTPYTTEDAEKAYSYNTGPMVARAERLTPFRDGVVCLTATVGPVVVPTGTPLLALEKRVDGPRTDLACLITEGEFKGRVLLLSAVEVSLTPLPQVPAQ